MKKPTCEEIFYEVGLKSVCREVDDSWRHGVYVTEVYKRESDGTYWEASYQLSGDGETNELREGCADIVQVIPQEKTVITYVNA
jgi:hypothetical protein